MFSIYINDIVKYPNLLNFTFYADDTNIHLASSDVNNFKFMVNKEDLYASHFFHKNLFSPAAYNWFEY